jgi:spore germination protein
MYQRLSSIMFPIVTLLLIGTVVWGYQVNQEKNSILIKAENQYQRAFHDLSYYVDKLHSELGNALALNSSSHATLRKELANIWRITSQAQNEINQLPLTLLPFNQTEELLSNISNFAYRTAVRDLSKEPLNEDEKKTLSALYEHSKEIAAELRNVQSKVIANNLRWMDVESALASEKESKDNTIIDGFQTVNKKVSAYEELNWGPSMESIYEKRTYNALDGSDTTAEEIRQKAEQFMGGTLTNIQVAENGAGTEYSSFSVTGQRPDGTEVTMDFTKKGGQLIWYMAPRDTAEAKISPEQAIESARTFLGEHGYPGMDSVNYESYGNTATIVFASSQNGVTIYPEKITVRVALDNGDVTGLSAKDYLFAKKNRELAAPKLTPEQARSYLNPNFAVEGESRALIKNELGKEVQCYEFTGRINGSFYRIFLNADTGEEEKIEQLKQAGGETAA